MTTRKANTSVQDLDMAYPLFTRRAEFADDLPYFTERIWHAATERPDSRQTFQPSSGPSLASHGYTDGHDFPPCPLVQTHRCSSRRHDQCGKIIGMDDNPYKSPEANPPIEKPPSKPRNRYFDAIAFGLAALGGVGLSQEVVLQILAVPLEMKIAERVSTMPVFSLTPIVVGVTVACWIWRHPNSRRARIVALLLMLSPVALFAVSIAITVLVAWRGS